MKYLKMLGLAAVAAMGLMAFFGASSASATVLCKQTDTPSCAVANKYGVGTVIHASLKSGTSAKLWADPKGENPLVTCTESTVRGTIANAGGSESTVSGPLTTTLNPEGKHTGLTWGGCTSTTDTLTTGSSIGELEIHHIAGTHDGTVTSKNSDVTVSIFGVSCTYGSGNGLDLGILKGGTKQVLSINATISKVAGSFLCPEKTIWEAEYTVTEPHEIYVTAS
jgi:hypothetical protein